MVKVEKRSETIDIRIGTAGGQEHALIEAIRQCRQSAWACTSGECVNVESMTESIDGNDVCITLTPKAGTRLDPAGIEECLRYLIPQKA